MLQAVTRPFLERGVWGSNLWPVKSDTMLTTDRHHREIASKKLFRPQAQLREDKSRQLITSFDVIQRV